MVAGRNPKAVDLPDWETCVWDRTAKVSLNWENSFYFQERRNIFPSFLAVFCKGCGFKLNKTLQNMPRNEHKIAESIRVLKVLLLIEIASFEVDCSQRSHRAHCEWDPRALHFLGKILPALQLYLTTETAITSLPEREILATPEVVEESILSALPDRKLKEYWVESAANSNKTK